MSRSARQSKILDIIFQRNVETQDELVEALRNDGFEVTQATVSRDIKELGLVKTQDANGRYRYSAKNMLEGVLSTKQMTVLREAVVSIVTAENLVVVETLADSASVVSGAIPQFSLSNVLGVLAAKKTVLLLSPPRGDANPLADRIPPLL